jgi:hypothetical protein
MYQITSINHTSQECSYTFSAPMSISAYTIERVKEVFKRSIDNFIFSLINSSVTALAFGQYRNIYLIAFYGASINLVSFIFLSVILTPLIRHFLSRYITESEPSPHLYFTLGFLVNLNLSSSRGALSAALSQFVTRAPLHPFIFQLVNSYPFYFADFGISFAVNEVYSRCINFLFRSVKKPSGNETYQFGDRELTVEHVSRDKHHVYEKTSLVFAKTVTPQISHYQRLQKMGIKTFPLKECRMTGERPFLKNWKASKLTSDRIEFQEQLPETISFSAETSSYKIETTALEENQKWNIDSIHELAKIAAGFQRLNLSLEAYKEGICMAHGKVYLRFRPELFTEASTPLNIDNLTTGMDDKDKEIFRLAVENYSKTLNFSYLNLATI